MKNYTAYIKHFALSIKKLNQKKVLLLLLTLIVSIQPAKVFALKDMVFHGNSSPLFTIAKPAFVATTQPMVKVFISSILTLEVATIVTPSLILVKFLKLNFKGKLTLWPSSYKIITAPA